MAYLLFNYSEDGKSDPLNLGEFFSSPNSLISYKSNFCETWLYYTLYQFV